MAAGFTRKGVETLLKNTNRTTSAATNANGIAYCGTKVVLLHDTTVFTSNPTTTTLGAIGSGAEFKELASGNGYTAGGLAITDASYTYDAANSQVVIADQIWTATGTLSGVGGAALVDAAGTVLAYWSRTSVNVSSGQTVQADDLTLRLA